MAFKSGALYFTLQNTFRHTNAHRIDPEQKITANEGNIEDNATILGIVEGQVNSMGGQTVSTNRRIDENKVYIEQNTVNIDENAIKMNENTTLRKT